MCTAPTKLALNVVSDDKSYMMGRSLNSNDVFLCPSS